MPRFINQTATIPAGQSLSDVINCSTGAPVMIFIPHGWAPSHLSFQVSHDGASFYDLFDNAGVEQAFNVAAGTAVALDPSWTPVTYLKLGSGSRAAPVPQAADRTLVVTIDTKPTQRKPLASAPAFALHPLR